MRFFINQKDRDAFAVAVLVAALFLILFTIATAAVRLDCFSWGAQ